MSHRSTPTRVLEYVALVLAALSSGVLFGTKVGLGPSTQAFGAETYTDVQQATVRNLRPVMGALLPASAVANLTLLVARVRNRDPGVATAVGVAAGGQLAAIALTAAFELPTNARVLGWRREAPPAGWERERDRWDLVHTLRTLCSLIGFGALAAAVVARRG